MKMYQVSTLMDGDWTPTLDEARSLAKQLIKQGSASFATINRYVVDGPPSVAVMCDMMNGAGWANEIEQLEVWERDETHPSGLKRITSR